MIREILSRFNDPAYLDNHIETHIAMHRTFIGRHLRLKDRFPLVELCIDRAEKLFDKGFSYGITIVLDTFVQMNKTGELTSRQFDMLIGSVFRDPIDFEIMVRKDFNAAAVAEKVPTVLSRMQKEFPGFSALFGGLHEQFGEPAVNGACIVLSWFLQREPVPA